jgi:hypothetical protein
VAAAFVAVVFVGCSSGSHSAKPGVPTSTTSVCVPTTTSLNAANAPDHIPMVGSPQGQDGGIACTPQTGNSGDITQPNGNDTLGG